MDCLFCAIVEGKVDSREVYRDDTAVAFLDINPWHAGHTLVVPRRHITDVRSESAALGEIGAAINATARLLTHRLGAAGLNVLINSGAVAGQEVFHLHAHLIPRYADRPGMAGLMKRDENVDLDAVHRQLTESGQVGPSAN